MTDVARAETVGSLLRPPVLREAREEATAGKISATGLRKAEDEAIIEAIALQESVGLDVISDGEFRRSGWNAAIGINAEAPFTGYTMVDGMNPIWRRFWRTNSGERRPSNAAPGAVVTSKLAPQRDIVTDEFGFLEAHSNRRSKYTFPAPSYHRAFWNPEASKNAYATVDEYLTAVRDIIRSFIVDKAIALGCDYIQLDAPNYGQLYADPEVRAAYEAEGHDIGAELAADAELDSSLFEGLSGITTAIHVCRGNGPGGIWSASGGYEHFAEGMFPRLKNINTLLLEYDSDRAGGFEPLQHVIPGTTVVLGLLTTKLPTLENAADVEGRIREAAGYVPLENLALSPQCGFSSAPGGNPLSPNEQRAKLQLVADVAHRVWA